MTKRVGDALAKNAKKTKVDDDFENLWGDDIDDEALDNLIKVATQVENTNDTQKDVTILPTYNTFKQSTKAVYSSTQMEASFLFDKHAPSTSKASANNLTKNNQSYQLEMIELRQRCEEKEGEAAILRNQLKDIKANIQIEQEKKKHEWLEKLGHSEKQISSLRTQLDFKNLEIANLRQKISDVAKRTSDVNLNCIQNNCNPSKPDSRNSTLKPSTSKGNIVTKAEIVHKIQPICESVYPLQGLIAPEFPLFETCVEDSYVTEIKNNSSDSDINPYLQKRLTQSETKSVKHLKPVKNFKAKQSANNTKDGLSIEDVHQSLASLLNCTEDEINAEYNRGYLNKILSFTLQAIENFHEYLNSLLLNTQADEVQSLDHLYISNYTKKRKSRSDQIAITAGKCMYILSELVLCSVYLQKTLLKGEELHGVEVDGCPIRQAKLMEKLLDIAKLIGRLRKAHLCVDFLISVVKFMTSVCKTPYFDDTSHLFSVIVKQIVFSRPHVDTIEHLVNLFLCGSQHDGFSESICNKPHQTTISVNLIKGIIFFNEDSCPFHVFVILVNNSVLDLREGSHLSLPLCSKLLCFVENILEANCYWTHHKEGKRCECLDQFYKLSVDIVYQVLCSHKDIKKKNCYALKKATSFFRCGIRILSLLSFNSYDLTEKYITVYSQFKEIVHSMMELQENLQLDDDDLNLLDKLNINEDIPTISSDVICL